MVLPMNTPTKRSMVRGTRVSNVRVRSIRSILEKARLPRNRASQNIKRPSPKHSWMVSRSLVNRLMRLPTLFTW